MAREIKVDFTGVESGGGFVHIPEGDYGFKVTKVTKKKSEQDNDYLLFSCKVTQGHKKGIGKTIAHTCTLTQKSLWNLRNLLEASGKTVPSKAVKIDLDNLVGIEFAGTVVDDEYNGKKKSQITAFFPLADLSPDESGDDESSDDSGDEPEEKPKKGKGKKKDEDEEDSGEESSESSDEEGEELFG